MRDQELPNRFRLNVIVLSEDRSREINFRPDPHEPGKLTRQVTIWTRKVKLDDNVHVHESPKGELRAVKRVSRKDGVLPDPTSELDVLGQVSKAMEIQNKQTFVHFHGWFLSKDYLYLAMEYCSFGDVSKCFPDPLCEVETRRICEQLLEGLVVLHEMGIAHRDIKPQNILVVQKDPIQIRLADFGISKRALEGQTELRTQIGTRGYMAPEVLGIVDESQEDSTYTSAVDIWSLGCLLYYMLTKETPFSEYEFLLDYVKGLAEFPVISLIEQEVSHSAQRFLSLLLAPCPGDRPKARIDLMGQWAIAQGQNEIHVAPSKHVDSIETEGLKRMMRDSSTDTLPRISSDLTPPIHRPNGPIESIESDLKHLDFYSYELWQMLKSTKSKTAPAERLVSILDRNADPNFLHNGYNALHFAAEHGSAEWVKVLLEYDANVQITTKARSETALHLATWQNDIDVFLEKLQLLRQYEVHLDAQNSDGDTALHLVIRRFRSVEAVEALLSAGASTEIKDRQGRTPLFYALNLEQEEKAMALLDGGANVNCQDETGRSLLHLAIASRRISTDFINRLVCATIDINQPDQNGHTPLFHAVKLNKRDIITLLHHRGGEYGLGNSGPRQGLAQGDWWRRLKLGIF